MILVPGKPECEWGGCGRNATHVITWEKIDPSVHMKFCDDHAFQKTHAMVDGKRPTGTYVTPLDRWEDSMTRSAV